MRRHNAAIMLKKPETTTKHPQRVKIVKWYRNKLNTIPPPPPQKKKRKKSKKQTKKQQQKTKNNNKKQATTENKQKTRTKNKQTPQTDAIRNQMCDIPALCD